MSTLGLLLTIQELDTQLAQLRHRHDHLPEAENLQRIRNEIGTIEAEITRVAGQDAALAATVSSNEATVVDIRKKIDRLNAQMKTVIAPREAEALQHEIALLAEEASALDEAALTAMEESEILDSCRTTLQAELGTKLELAAAAHTALDDARAEVVDLIGEVTTRRAMATESIDVAVLADYDNRRAAHAGIAVAKLSKSTCGGCHIDLSTMEIDQLKRIDEEQRECPNCARWLVL